MHRHGKERMIANCVLPYACATCVSQQMETDPLILTSLELADGVLGVKKKAKEQIKGPLIIFL